MKPRCLGIDHTAIVVANTAANLKFYCDLRGLKVAGEGMHAGIEQEHLNNEQSARLHITLRFSAGPGIEFLAYLEPKDGRSLSVAVKPNDRLHWQTTLCFAIHRMVPVSPNKPSAVEPFTHWRPLIWRSSLKRF